MTLSDVTGQLRDDLETLEDIDSDPEDAVSALDNVAFSLREQANELERISSVVADAQSILS